MRGLRIAVICSPSDECLLQIETGAYDRGVNRRFFFDVDEARAWLVSDDPQPVGSPENGSTDSKP